ncbi:MAG: transposase [Methanocellales archaeon]
MIRNLLEQVSAMSNPFPRKQKGNYRGKKRGRKPADYISVIMCLLLKVILKKSYRELYSLLKSDRSLRRLAGIKELPHYNTMNDYMAKLPAKYLDSLIGNLYTVGVERKKRTAEDRGSVEPSMVLVLQPSIEHSGIASELKSALLGENSSN